MKSTGPTGIKFYDADLRQAAYASIRNLHVHAGCSLKQLKELFSPNVIEAVVQFEQELKECRE